MSENTSSNIVKWGSYEAEAAAEERDNMSKNANEFMKLKEGRNVVRILPPLLGKKSPFRVVWTHYINMPGAADPVSFVCPRNEVKRPCPICNQADRLKTTKNPADRNRASELFAKRRVYANVINRESPELGPVILSFGKTVHEALISLRDDKEFGDFTHPETGYDIIIERKGTGKNDTKYTVRGARTSKLGDLSWIEQQVDLDRYATVLSDAEIEEKMRNGGISASRSEPRPAGGSRSAGAHRTVEHDTYNTDVDSGGFP